MIARVIIFACILLLAQTAAAQTKIACVGTSITAGVPGSFSYPQFLSQLLGNQYPELNAGQSGTTLYAYVGSAAAPGVFSALPDIITIELGTNDSKAGFNRTEFATAYNRLIDTFLTIRPAPSIRLVLPIPILANPYQLSPDTMALAIVPIIRTIATQRHLSIIDCNTPFVGHPELYESDGTHPLRFEPAGYDTLAHIFFRALAGAPTKTERSAEEMVNSNVSVRERLRLALYGQSTVVLDRGYQPVNVQGRMIINRGILAEHPYTRERPTCR